MGVGTKDSAVAYEALLEPDYVAMWGSDHVAHVVEIVAARGLFRTSTMTMLLRSSRFTGARIEQFIALTRRLVSDGLLTVSAVIAMLPEVAT